MMKKIRASVLLATLLFGFASTAWALIPFNSGSTGVDGALNLTTAGTVLFDPYAMGIDTDGDGIFHFTTINIAAGVTVKFASYMGAVKWLASGNVTISGTIDLYGQAGNDPYVSPFSTNAQPGPGGFAGGMGSTSIVKTQSGSGPGGGHAFVTGNSAAIWNGGGAGYLSSGGDAGSPLSGIFQTSGTAYGNIFLLPLIGGSGGAGGGTDGYSGIISGGGGAGGGAILIVSSGVLTLNGKIIAKGGDGGNYKVCVTSNILCHGGAGSGGAIRLVAETINGNGLLSAAGGTVPSITQGFGSAGRMRLEAYLNNFRGTFGSPVTQGSPGMLFLPVSAMPVRVVSIDGYATPANPRASFAPADITINKVGASTVNLEAHGIPLGTTITVTLHPENGIAIVATSTPLAGTLAASTATASVIIPHGFSRFYITATWVP